MTLELKTPKAEPYDKIRISALDFVDLIRIGVPNFISSSNESSST